jgi:hypothetical protein
MSLQGLVTLATDAAGEETSKTPFYLLGGLLALYAVAISFVGLRGRASFPASVGARNGVLALTTLLVVAAMASAVLSS